ncbi:gamma-aminobutyric acid type B receptor subunit 2-like [Ptychodera flava]|uniref:gamma-aminobutyric acid type B receptor subunit 2-like n=1 Tax=Ptychodera flava TaxID=63121 RepID=UPI003969EC73
MMAAFLRHPDSLLVVLLFSVGFSTPGNASKTELHISGLLYYYGNKAAFGLLPAAEMALEYVNNRTDILGDYTLVLNDSDAYTPGVANKLLMDQIFNGPQKYMVYGPISSSIAEVISQTAPLYNLIQVSPSVTSASLSNTRKYPTLFRTVQSDNTNNPARLALLQHFDWTVVGTIAKDDALFTSVMEEFHDLLDVFNITVRAATTFTTNPSGQIKQLKDANARIIIAMNYGTAVLCEAFKAGMYGPKYQWFLTGGQGSNFYLRSSENQGCTEEDMLAVSEGAILTDHSYWGEENERAISGHTPGEFKAELIHRMETVYGVDDVYVSDYAPCAFDAIWAIALALNGSIEHLPDDKTLPDFTYEDDEMATIFYEEMLKTHFVGVTGPVHFTGEGDREGRVIIYQIQGGEIVEVGIHDAYHDTIEWDPQHPLRWQGGDPPVDSVVQHPITIGLTPAGFVAIATVSSLGICFCVFFLWFNIKYRSHRFIKMSSPRLNNLMILGCLLTYLAAILFGLDTNTLNHRQLSFVCNLRIWIMVFGFTLAFGSMFSKTWRVHVLFTNKKIERKVVKDGHLFAMVGSFLALDGALLVTWMLLDPQRVVVQVFPPKEHPTEEDILLVPSLATCKSVYNLHWLVTIYTFKGILVLFGIFLAWETRRVQIPGLNDSKQIGFCTYNVMVMSVLGITITNILDHSQVDVKYAITAVCIIVCTTATLALVFVPKVWAIHRNSVEDMSTRFNASANEQSTTDGTVHNEMDMHKYKVEILKLKTQVEHLQRQLWSKEKESFQMDASTSAR